ncbi:MAG: YceI family protein [Verrucomicrobiota bacterium]|nr:YceI family protein [Verrucomicrobiota bacterium]
MKSPLVVTSFIVLGTTLFAFSASSAPETYKIDPVHSAVGFKVRHLFSYVLGKFTKFDGSFTVDSDAVEKSLVSATVQTNSVDTGNEKRDGDLRSPDFFDATKFPEISFKSKSVKSTGKDTADVVGDFTMHGVTKELTLHAQFLGKGKGMAGEVSGWHLTSDPIKRTDYGLNWSKVIEGTAVVGDDVEITIDVEADKVNGA